MLQLAEVGPLGKGDLLRWAEEADAYLDSNAHLSLLSDLSMKEDRDERTESSLSGASVPREREIDGLPSARRSAMISL